jgi:hypothetical protein
MERMRNVYTYLSRRHNQMKGPDPPSLYIPIQLTSKVVGQTVSQVFRSLILELDLRYASY